MHRIIIEQVNNNDDEYQLIEWFVHSGDKVNVGDPLAGFETSKSSFELESKYKGYIFIPDEEQTSFKPGDSIGMIYESMEEITTIDGKSEQEGPDVIKSKKIFTKKAQKIMARENLAESLFWDVDKPIIQAGDIESYLAGAGRQEKKSISIDKHQQEVARVVEKSFQNKPSSFAVVKVNYSALEKELFRYRKEKRAHIGIQKF